MANRALITGVLGMDASILSEHLVELGYDVYGLYKRVSTGNSFKNIAKIQTHKRFHLIDGDAADSAMMNGLIYDLKPDELYCLAAQSHVGYSFTNPMDTWETNTKSVLIQLEAIRQFSKSTKFYFAGSSEVFGGLDCPVEGYSENSPHNPRSVYACSKVAGINLTTHYRKAHGLFACSGLLFNHSAPARRGLDFFTRKATNSVAKIKLGLLDKMKAGNLDAFRDEGCSYDYVRAQHLMLQQPSPDDYVVATGSGATMRQMLEYVCNLAELDLTDVYELDPRFIRPSDVPYLLGNASKIRSLGWEPKYDWKRLLKEMYEADLDIERAGKGR